MSLLRQDPLTGAWVIIAGGRKDRPDEFGMSTPAAAGEAGCPFCPGHEARTTPEIMATGRPAGQVSGGPGWRIRVFGNMFPALRPEAQGPLPVRARPDLFPAGEARGRHEVVAYTPDHQGSLARLPADHLTELLGVVRDRMRDMSGDDPAPAHVLPFCNHGPHAGATLSHPHLQILAGPLVPATIAGKIVRLQEYRDQRGTCLVCETAAAEIGDGARVVARNAGAVCLTPWASRFSFEMRVIPLQHQARFEDAGDALLAQVGNVLQSGLASLEKIHENPSYNVIILSGPVPGPEPGNTASVFHWHIEILPRLARLAGFEAGSGFAINPVWPEDAARRLREAGSA